MKKSEIYFEPKSSISKFDKNLSKLDHFQSLKVSSTYDVSITILTNSLPFNEMDDNLCELEDYASQWPCLLLVRNPMDWIKEFVQPAFAHWLPYVKINFYTQRLYEVDIQKLRPR